MSEDALTSAYGRTDDGHHYWTAVGSKGAIHIWAAPRTNEQRMLWGGPFFGGVEVHSRAPVSGDRPPDHEKCWLLDGSCWHDGSSLYFTEQIAPRLARFPDGEFPPWVHTLMEGELHSFYRAQFHSPKDTE